MDELQTMSTQAIEGQGTTPVPPQGTEPGAQVPVQHQENASVQVENGNINASSHGEPSVSSDVETARWMKRVERQMRANEQLIKQQSELIERQRQSQSSQGIPQTQAQITNDDVAKDPVTALRKLIQAEVQGLKTEVPQHIQQVISAQKYEQAQQEALRLIKTNSSVKADPEGQDRIADILTEEDEFGNSLEKYALTNPRHAAQLALMEYQNRFMGGKRSQSAPTKAQMQTTATAVTSGVPKNTTAQEAKEFYRQVIDHPELMQNPEFLKKYAAFQEKADKEKLAQGK